MDHSKTKKSSTQDCYEFLDLSDVDDGVKDALASTLNTTTQQPGGGIPAAAAAGGGKPKQQQQYHSYRPRRRQSNASSVMSSSDGSGVYDYPPSSSAAAATFPYPLEYHQPSQQQSPQNHPTPQQQQHHQHYFPYAAATTAIVAPYEDGGVTDRSTGSGGGPPSRYHYQKRQKDGGGNSRPPYQQYQQHYQHHHHYNQSWSPPAAAAASSSSASSSSTAASTTATTLPNTSANGNVETTYYNTTTTTASKTADYGETGSGEQPPHHHQHHQSHHQQHYYGSYRVGPSGRSYRRRSETYGATSTTTTSSSSSTSAVTATTTSTTTSMPPHTNTPHYQQQQQQQQQGQQSQQQQSQPNVTRGGEQGSVAPQQQQPIYPSQPIPAGYMVGGPHANAAMYPMQVIPQPGNVYVSNLTANVNVHGFMPHGMPGYMAAATTGTPSGPAGAAYIASEVPGHEMQQVMTPRDGRTAAMRRNGTSGSNGSTGGRNGSRLGSTPRPARNYVPHHLQQQQQPAASQPVIIQAPMPQPAQSQTQQSAGGQQPQQSQTSQQSQQQQGQSQPQTPDIVQQAPQQQQHPAMAMEPQQVPYGYSGGYYNYIPMQFYQPVPMGHHPSAQHAAGAPIFQVPMYSAAPMYGYPGVMYPTIYQPEYPMYDDKGDEQNPQPSPEEGGVMHQALWQPPTMIEYNPESGEYIQHEDDEGAMLPPGPPQMQPIAHVLDPNVPNFTMQMGPPTPIPDDEYAPSEEYNANTMMSPAPSSRASSLQNLTQSEMYLVPQQQQPQEPQHLHQQQHMQMMDLEEVAMHEQAMVDHEGNYLIEEEEEEEDDEEEIQSYQQQEPPMSPSPPPPQQQQQQQHIHVQSPHEMVYNPEPIQQQMVVVEQQPALPIQETPQPEVTQVCEPEPAVREATPPLPPPTSAVLDKPPPPIPFEILKHQHEQQLQKQQQQQQQLQQTAQSQTQPQYNDTNNNNQKKKTNEVALAATPGASVEPQPAKESASKPNQTQQTSFKSQTSDELAKLTRAVQEKFVLNDDRGKSSFRWANPNAPVATTTIASFTSPTTTVVTGQPMQKKTTASVSVSAIPNKEYTPATSTSAVKPYQKNTSPIPFTALGSTATPLAAMQHKQPLAPQKSYTDSSVGVVATAPTMESKKVEAIPHREPPHHIQPPPGPPPLLSVPPPVIPAPSYAPPPPAATPAVAAPAKSWASLFNSSSSSSSASAPAPAPTAAPSLAPSTAITAGPPPSSTSANPALPTHSPFAASFMPALARSGSGHTPAEAASIPSKKPIAKVLPFDKSGASASMSYSAAANQTTSTQPKPNKPNQPQQQQQHQQQHLGKVPDQLDENTLKLGEFLNTYQIENNSISIQPRGLINRSNYCYINAILQALVACPPFYHLMRAIRSLPAARNSKHPKPFIDAMTALVAEFSTLPLRSKVARDKTKKDETPDITTDTPLEPVVIHKILALLRSDIFQVEGRQEDAEEFLGCVLNRLNDEMLELMKLSKNESEVNGSSGNSSAEESGDGHGDDQDDWKVIRGNRNKGTITRTTDFGRSPMSDIFGGKLRSRVHREGDHPTDNIQPFFTLQLDIEKAASVKDALDLLVGKDQLEGMTCSKTKQEIQAWQQVTLEELPIVMILHLKCFDYKMDGCTKILKTLEFPIELKIDSKLMSSKGKAYTAKQKQYKLFAVVYHDGKEASKGHYITDVFHAGYGTWIRYDDSTVRAVPEFNVLHPKAPRVPYLLYYRRLDTHYHGGGGAGAGAGAPAGGAPAGTASSNTNSSNISSSNNNSNSNNSSSSANSSTNYSSGGGSYYGGGPGPK
ncbi:proline-rich protein 36 isoform X3 [Culex pipiens pallens]|uniref:proline-rich protein 36 isoform X3 n=1 Tax=Culex pipiens pallens TaxID=42434 RepID=UPI0022AAD88C|nr:proline-rich protein 36 isoform X3 [Culex pipiens pallens]